jgi:hypothetical protein
VQRALVPLAPPAQGLTAPCASVRPSADFVAHLIATAAQAPQTRLRRRAAPQEAIAAYGAVGQWPIPPGRALSRSL